MQFTALVKLKACVQHEIIGEFPKMFAKLNTWIQRVQV